MCKTCGNCENCVPLDRCNGDYECTAKSDEKTTFEVSKDDSTDFYGEDDKPCEDFTEKKVIPDMNLTAKELKNILDKVDDDTIITIDSKSPKQIKIGIEYERHTNFIEKVVSAIANALSVLGTGKPKALGSNIAKTTFDIITERGASDEL